ncbi:MAG: DUF3617 domain-containing protein [Pseudomonadota bacterium]
MNPRIGALAVLAAATLSLSAHGANGIKPGLWEMNTQMHSANGEMEKAMASMQKQLDAMPPEQRKMVEDIMAKQGVSKGAAPGAMNLKMCVTAEMAARSEMPVHHQGNCTASQTVVAPGNIKVSVACTDPVSTGEGQITYTSDSAYTMKMTNTTTVKGKKEAMSMEAQGKWLGADCGSVKPYPMPPSK